MTRLLVTALLLSFHVIRFTDALLYSKDEEILNQETETGDEVSAPIYDDRIVGGQETTIEEHPYAVSFIFNDRYFCGAFIISENYIVTAAHCAKDVNATSVVLRAGSTFRTNGTIIPIAEVIAHPEYGTPTQFDKDVAVMRTVDPLEFSEVIQPIALPPRNRLMLGNTDIVVSGWGRLEQDANSIPIRLYDVRLPVVYRVECLASYPAYFTNNMFCAGNYFTGGQGSCQGDSGGAAIQEGVAVGIVSFGRGCGKPLGPGVFADVAAPAIRDFITKHTGL